MNEDRFNELMRDAAQTYRRPVEPDFDEMWTEIEARSALVGTASSADTATIGKGRFAARDPRWLAIAATLVIGLGLGRASAFIGRSADAQGAAVPVSAVAAARTDSAAVNNPYELETSKYLGQTAALLIALPSEVRAGRADDQFVGRASELLTTTRLLMDSPASNDPAMRSLLEDLELVLAQVVRLQNNHSRAESRTELDLINRALEQRDVLPRLRSAVGGYSAN